MQYLGAHHAQNNDSAITDVFVIKGVQAALERGKILVIKPNFPEFKDVEYS